MTAELAEDEPKAAPTPISSALWYASVGLRVFPLQPGTKIPYRGTRGCLDACTDEQIIREWWTAQPDANIGIATGYLVDVVDVDGPLGQGSRVEHWCYDETCREEGTRPTPPAHWTPHCTHEGVFNRIDREALGKVSTPRPGGMHIYVPATGDGNKAGIFPGVDYRGMGGYVVAPPSVITDGPNPGAYAWLGTPNLGGLA